MPSALLTKLAKKFHTKLLASAFIFTKLSTKTLCFDTAMFHLSIKGYCKARPNRSYCFLWRSRGNIIRTVLYIANVLPIQWAQLTKTVHTARLGLLSLSFCLFLCFLGCMIYHYVGVCFVLPWTVESFPNKTQCKTRELFMSLFIHY